MIIKANYVDIFNRIIFPAQIIISNGKIEKIEKIQDECTMYILPPFVDSHVHIESSMLAPSEFARAASVFGTVATVSDPHEIANVLGIPGIEFMIHNAKQVPFKFYFGVPSCVPATGFETSGARISSQQVEELFNKYELKYLSEMMNYPGVIYNDEEVLQKIKIAKKYNKIIDGHAPLLKGEDLKKYISAGISTDHECTSFEEAEEKIIAGMKIQIRAGSAANDFEALAPLLDIYPDSIMLASDDLHPDALQTGHINILVKELIRKKFNIFNVLRAASKNPVEHYNLNVGLLRVGDDADFILVNNLVDLEILQTFCDGQCIATDHNTLIKSVDIININNFVAKKITSEDIKISLPEELISGNKTNSINIRVISVADKEILTKSINWSVNKFEIEKNSLVSNIHEDILKIVVLNRYENKPPAIGFVSGFGLKEGAIATSVSHDSHNIIAVGVDDESIAQSINLIVSAKGGLSVVSNSDSKLCVYR